MEWLFSLLVSMTFVLCIVISSLLALLAWIAFPEIVGYPKTIAVFVLALSVVMTNHYSQKEYNPDKHYQSILEMLNDYQNDARKRS